MVNFPLFSLQAGKFLCDIGGILGLWIGFSFLTIFEVVELLFDLLLSSFYGKKGSSNNKPSIPDFPGKGTKPGAVVAPYCNPAGVLKHRFDPDYMSALNTSARYSPSDVKVQFHTPSPDFLSGGNDNVSVLEMTTDTTDERTSRDKK